MASAEITAETGRPERATEHGSTEFVADKVIRLVSSNSCCDPFSGKSSDAPDLSCLGVGYLDAQRAAQYRGKLAPCPTRRLISREYIYGEGAVSGISMLKLTVPDDAEGQPYLQTYKGEKGYKGAPGRTLLHLIRGRTYRMSFVAGSEDGDGRMKVMLRNSRSMDPIYDSYEADGGWIDIGIEPRTHTRLYTHNAENEPSLQFTLETLRFVSTLDHTDPTFGCGYGKPTETALDQGELNRLANASARRRYDDSGPRGFPSFRAFGRCDLCRLTNSVRDLGRQHLRELEGRIRRRGLSNLVEIRFL